MARYKNDGCSFITSIFFILFILFKILEFLFKSSNSALNIIAVIIVAVIVLFCLHYFTNSDQDKVKTTQPIPLLDKPKPLMHELVKDPQPESQISDTASSSKSIFRYTFFIILTIAGISFYFNQNHNKDSVSPESQPFYNDYSGPVADSAAPVIINIEPIWRSVVFKDIEYRIPSSMTTNYSSTSLDNQGFQDLESNSGVTITREPLTQNMRNHSIKDFMDNAKDLAERLNNSTRQNFDDSSLLNYGFVNFCGVTAFKLEQSSTLISGSKNLECLITSYHFYNNNFYYKATFCNPRFNSNVVAIISTIIESFKFTESINETGDFDTSYQTTSNTDYQAVDKNYIKVIPFNAGINEIPDFAYPTLQSCVGIFKEYPRSIVLVSGYSDSNLSSTNVQSSRIRAQYIINYLIDNGISQTRIIDLTNDLDTYRINEKRENSVYITSVIVRE